MMCLVIAANEGCHVGSIDIGHAYLNAERTEADGEEIIMEVEPFLVDLLPRSSNLLNGLNNSWTLPNFGTRRLQGY